MVCFRGCEFHVLIIKSLIDQVTITPEVSLRGVNRAVMDQLVKLYRDSHLGRRLPAYDGRKSLYTAGPLPFTSKDFVITLVDEEDGQGGPRYCYVLLSIYIPSLLSLSSYNLHLYADFLFYCNTGEKGSSELLSN